MVKTRAHSKTKAHDLSNKSSKKKKSEKVNKSKKKVVARQSKKSTTRTPTASKRREIPNVRRTNKESTEEPLDIWQAESVLIKDFEDIR